MKIWRSVGFGALSVVAFGAAVCVAGLAYRGYRQREIARAIAINTPNGIDEAMWVKIGGIDQWITIRGTDRANPVLLYVMGGPGDTMIPRAYALYRAWEGPFTVVQWDQRGAGRTYTRNGEAGSGPLSVERAVQDGIELAEFLRVHLHKQKIIVFGVSWGTLLGVRMVKERPDLFWAYAGSGQFVSGKEGEEVGYAALLAKVREAHDAGALADLERIGPQYYEDLNKLPIERRWLHRYLAPPSEASFTSKSLEAMFFSPGYSLGEYLAFDDGTMFSLRELWPQVIETDLRSLGPEFKVPVFVFQGADDFQTPTALTKAYFTSVAAPKKDMVLFPGAGHFVSLVMPDKILAELVARVRPCAAETTAMPGA